MDIAIHINPAQPHQREHAEWFESGIARHGRNCKIITTDAIDQQADIHIISGPHYAERYWLGNPAVLKIDRAYYNEEKSGRWASMDWISIGWLNKDGSREFTIGSDHKRRPPRIKDRRTGNGSIFLADYRGRIDQADTIRLHPCECQHTEPLADALRRHDTAIGYQTTALVTAALEGLNIICKDSRHILNQPNWHELLPWADWKYLEIQNGDAWEHLQQSLDQRKNQYR